VSSDRAELRLVGAGGEPVDLARTLASHGFADLPPLVLDEDARTLELTFALDGGARSARATSAATGTPPRGIPRTTTSSRLAYFSNCLCNVT